MFCLTDCHANERSVNMQTTQGCLSAFAKYNNRLNRVWGDIQTMLHPRVFLFLFFEKHPWAFEFYRKWFFLSLLVCTLLFLHFAITLDDLESREKGLLAAFFAGSSGLKMIRIWTRNTTFSCHFCFSRVLCKVIFNIRLSNILIHSIDNYHKNK